MKMSKKANASLVVNSGILPASVDLRPNFIKWGLGPRNQLKRNTCSVFAVTGALEYAMAAGTGRGVRFSVEFLNWTANGAAGRERDGAFFLDLYHGYEKYGICPEEDMPYQEKADSQRQPQPAAMDNAKKNLRPDIRINWIKHWDPQTGLTTEQMTEIKKVLHNNWPVCGGFRWPKKAELDKKDTIGMFPPDEVFDGHSVILAGYQDDASYPGGGRFIFRNTQNDGRDGYMCYEYAATYMNDALWIDYHEIADGEEEAPPAVALSVNDVIWPMGFIPHGRSRRISSNQQPNWNDANLDFTWLMPGESLNMPVLDGPGVINHIWFTSHAGGAGELNSLTLRIYYDGDSQPGVEAPLGDFFAVGHGKPAEVNSFPVQVSPTGSLTCYWRMPFRKSARIVVTNDHTDISTGLYWQVDWMQLPELPPQTPYFYARYRQEYPAVPKRDYLLADLKGRGFYVGTIMSITLGQDGWFGEGDDFFYIDGESIPSLQGTGSEDYFNDAWGFRPRASLWFGQPCWQGYSAGDRGICYRWHLPDPVYFSRSLRVTIEHKGNLNEAIEGYFMERPDFFSSVAFWYQTGKPQDSFPPLPDWRTRAVPWQHHHLVKTYLQAKTSDKSKVTVEAQGFFGARPVLAWSGTKAGVLLTLPFELAEDGQYAIRLTAVKGPDYGAYDIELDGKKVVATDFRHAAEIEEADVALGTHVLPRGKHTIAFRAVGKDGQAGALGVEVLRLLKLPAPAQRQERTHNEAHFIRLAIGRSMYAYRLAFGVIPDSLEMLVAKGFLPERYLRDENNLPLKCTKQDDAIIVESPGRDHWTHSWKGLDARR